MTFHGGLALDALSVVAVGNPHKQRRGSDYQQRNGCHQRELNPVEFGDQSQPVHNNLP